MRNKPLIIVTCMLTIAGLLYFYFRRKKNVNLIDKLEASVSAVSDKHKTVTADIIKYASQLSALSSPDLLKSVTEWQDKNGRSIGSSIIFTKGIADETETLPALMNRLISLKLI